MSFPPQFALGIRCSHSMDQELFGFKFSEWLDPQLLSRLLFPWHYFLPCFSEFHFACLGKSLKSACFCSQLDAIKIIFDQACHCYSQFSSPCDHKRFNFCSDLFHLKNLYCLSLCLNLTLYHHLRQLAGLVLKRDSLNG